jgi:hypothetical protein
MRDNFDVHEWNIRNIREAKNISGDEAVTKTIEFLRKSIYPKLTDDEMDKFVVGICEFMDCTPPSYRLNEDKSITEGWNDKIEKIGISYVSNGKLYSISVNGEKQRGEDFDNIKKLIQDATQIDISNDRHIDKVVDFMKGLGIEVTVFEMDVS